MHASCWGLLRWVVVKRPLVLAVKGDHHTMQESVGAVVLDRKIIWFETHGDCSLLMSRKRTVNSFPSNNSRNWYRPGAANRILRIGICNCMTKPPGKRNHCR